MTSTRPLSPQVQIPYTMANANSSPHRTPNSRASTRIRPPQFPETGWTGSDGARCCRSLSNG